MTSLIASLNQNSRSLPNSQALDDGYRNSLSLRLKMAKLTSVAYSCLAKLGKSRWDKQNQPSDKELPDSLFPKGSRAGDYA